MCIAQFNLHLVVLVVAILPITRPAIASHNLARLNPGINPGIPGLSKLNPEIPGLAKRSGIAFPIDRLKALTLLKSVDGGIGYSNYILITRTRLAKKRLLSELVVYTACMHDPSLLTTYITGKIVTCYVNETKHYFIAP